VLAGCSAGGGGDAGTAGDSGASAPDATAAGDSPGSFYAADGRRIVVRQASIAIEIDDYASTLDTIRSTATERGGYVGDRDRQSRGPWDGGTIVVKVPPENFSAVRDRIATLGSVESESVDVQDFSNEYNQTGARLADLRREERTLERRLNRTDDPHRADDIRSDLDDLRHRIRNLEEKRQGFERRAAMSTITVDVHEPEQRKPPATQPDLAGFGDAFADSLYSGLIVVKWVLIVLGYGIPTVLGMFVLGVFGTVSIAGWRRLRTILRDRFGIDLRRRSSSVRDDEQEGNRSRSSPRRQSRADHAGSGRSEDDRSRPSRPEHDSAADKSVDEEETNP
ncbi:MAG: hypothetical protein ACI8VE_002756, partial [Natrialbaceae archaeon]